MRGEGSIAEMVTQQYKKYGKLYGMNGDRWELNTTISEGRESRENYFNHQPEWYDLNKE